jgi:membrane-associated phospholipid phosphatase
MWQGTNRTGEARALHGIWCSWLFFAVACLGMASWCPALRAQDAPQTAAAEATRRTATGEAAPQDSASRAVAADPAAQQPGAQQTTPAAAGAEREVSWGKLPRNFLQDQKDIWLFPVQLGKGRHWLPTIGVTGVTAALIVADPHDTPYFRRTARFEGFNDAFSGRITSAEIAAVPAAFLIVGHFRHHSYAEKTALLAGEAYADSAILDMVMKAATRRLRPSDIAPSGAFSDTFFHSHVSPSVTKTSFPSGHAAAAFALATVFAHRYRQHRWVPWVAYGVAGAISFSRITTQAHFPSDVFVGAALGYTMTKFVVLRPR